MILTKEELKERTDREAKEMNGGMVMMGEGKGEGIPPFR